MLYGGFGAENHAFVVTKSTRVVEQRSAAKLLHTHGHMYIVLLDTKSRLAYWRLRDNKPIFVSTGILNLHYTQICMGITDNLVKSLEVRT